jgi:gamma-glutamyltranspeptidase / glutathione hydrolase
MLTPEHSLDSHGATLYGSRQAISAGHHLAAAAGYSILEAGGNATDAGCAAGISLAVLCPFEVSAAGVAPIMIRQADGSVITLAGLGAWPTGIEADLFVREHDGAIPVGLLQTVVPAAPDAWLTALRDFGTMTFGEVVSDAIRFARDGFAVYEFFAESVASEAAAYAMWPQNAAIFLPSGRPPRVGERFVQEDLARSLEYMAREERLAASRGRAAGLEAARAAFYTGELADRIVDYHEAHGGHLTREDLASFRTPREPPVRIRWRDFELFTCGPWCQGPVLAQALLLVERLGLSATRIDDPNYAHLVIEALKAAFADREYRYGDPELVDVRVDELMSPEHLETRGAAIDLTRAYPELPGPIGTDPSLVELLPAPAKPPLTGGRHDTSYVCVIDRWGNVFSATPSDATSESPVIPGTGFVPSSRGTQSRADPRHPAGVAPGKRPRLTPSPALAVRDDGSVFVFGCPGGDMQAQAMLQVFLNVFHFGLDVQEAIDAPRVSTWSFPNSFAPHEYLPNHVAIEGRYSDPFFDDLVRRGHDVNRWPDFTRSAAAVEAIFLDATEGFLRAGADPRQPAQAIVS